jgi:hypothetical protein
MSTGFLEKYGLNEGKFRELLSDLYGDNEIWDEDKKIEVFEIIEEKYEIKATEEFFTDFSEYLDFRIREQEKLDDEMKTRFVFSLLKESVDDEKFKDAICYGHDPAIYTCHVLEWDEFPSGFFLKVIDGLSRLVPGSKLAKLQKYFKIMLGDNRSAKSMKETEAYFRSISPEEKSGYL